MNRKLYVWLVVAALVIGFVGYIGSQVADTAVAATAAPAAATPAAPAPAAGQAPAATPNKVDGQQA